MKNENGFTLIEVIVTMAIIGIISLPLFNVFSSGLNNIVRAGYRTEAVEVAKIDLANDPTLVERTIKVTIPIEDGNVIELLVHGNEAIGEGSKNRDLSNGVEVQIKTFIPYY